MLYYYNIIFKNFIKLIVLYNNIIKYNGTRIEHYYYTPI